MGCAQASEKRQYTITQVSITNLYDIGAEIGRGAFSVVRLAEDLGSKRKIALKCINLPRVRGEIHHLNREVAILRELKHPNIVELIGVYQEDETMYLSMELCEGGSLKDLIDRGPLQETQVKAIAKQLLSALNYMHKKKIGHRDLKAENILFKEGTLKLADFGLARIMDKIKDYSRVGTPYYLAPEVIHGNFNWQCDIWSVGVLMFYALTGDLPFYGDDIEDLFDNIETAVSIDWGRVPASAREFVQKLMNPDRNNRITAEAALKERWLLS
mmetsp:Transcript_3287/g.6787  ORF Transcript_3287/g.6787 Transcript_3287/m.6787 type:complete len:271 (-) Transcript_3287:2371-3183(-)